MVGLAGSSVDKALFLLPRLLLTALFFFANNLRAEDVLLTVNVKKPVALTSDKFLSYTLDPTVVLTGNALLSNPERSVNMAKALAPAYVRIGGPRSNSYTFARPHRQQEEQDPDFTFTETDWIVLHRWAKNAGLDVLACIAPQHSEIGGRDLGWDSRNALDLISFSDHMGFNTSWQLGYESQTRCDVSGIDTGRDVMRLRSMLDAFPRYSKSAITGPDVVTYKSKQQQQYLQDYLSIAGTALSAITWHPDFASITLAPEGASLNHDNLALDRDGLYRVVGRLISKKPLWLAESKPEKCKKQFLGALVWTRRLGNAAKLGVQVIMRQPIDSNLMNPTPDYWVSVLHKSLVGREVLDTKITGNRTHVQFYCQCTKPSSKYEKGSLTIFGINLTPSKIVANLKGIKIKTLHKYILTPGFDAEYRLFSETVLLNNEPLNLLKERELPEIKPMILSNSKGVALKLPPDGIGFWVVPGLKLKLCGGVEEDNSDKMLLKKLTKRLEETESDEDALIEDEQEEEDDEGNTSAEERRFLSKPNKIKRRRKHRYSEEDDAERRLRKLEAKMDLERLEKLLRRRDSHDERKFPRGRTAYFGFEEKIDEENGQTGEEIRAKLEEYKNRLKEYESRKEANSKLTGKMTETQENETIDSEKVVEALMLISKMENAMKSLEKSDDDNPIETLDPSGSNDVTSGLVSPNKSGNAEDMFLDELLKSEKIKRTSVPSKIEDQLRAIYQMLAEEKLRRQRNLKEVSNQEVEQLIENPLQEIDGTPLRVRRDTEKKFGEDPLGLRKEGLFRRRTKNEDVRDRRIDRRRKKDKDDRKDGQFVLFDPRTTVGSNENHFYGFPQREPLKDFPKGDVFLTTGDSAEVVVNEYDYVTDDDDENLEQQSPMKISRTGETAKDRPELDDGTWIEDDNTGLGHLPKEFFEDVKMVAPRVQEHLKEYGELWEAESLGETQNYQVHGNVEDEEATVEKIVQERRGDPHEDKKANEATVRKLIRYYEQPRFHQEEEMEYMDTEGLDKPTSPLRNSPKSSVPSSEMRNENPIHSVDRNPVMAMNKKRVKDLASDEFGVFTDYDSMDFGRAAISSAEEEALGVYEDKYPVARPALRAKRFINDVEQIMNQEMIFQDDNNLKDCECRVIRGVKASDRRCRPNRRHGEDKGKLKNRERAPTRKPGGRFDKNYMHTTRTKRQAKSSIEEVEKTIVGKQAEAIEDSSRIPDATVDKTESPRASGESSEYEEDTSSDSHTVAAILASEVHHLVEEQMDVAAANENPDLDYGTGSIVKRHNKENVAAPLSQDSSKVSKKTESPAEVEAIQNSSAPEEPNKVSAKDSEADQLFLNSQPKDFEANSETVDGASKTNLTRHISGLGASPENRETSYSEDKRSTGGLNSVSMETTAADSPIATTSNPEEVFQEKNGPNRQEDGEDSTAGAAKGLLEDPQALKMNNEAKKEGEITAGRVKLEPKGSITTQSKRSSSAAKAAPKHPRPAQENTKTPRKTVQREKQVMKVVDPAKGKEAWLVARSNARQALKKENNSTKEKKAQENVMKTVSNDQAKLKASQKKRNEQLEKLRDKLRLKRDKIIQEYRDELLGEIDKATDGEERNLKRREIMGIINNVEELRDIVDRDKLDYLIQNKPINYETIRDEHRRTEDSEQRKKYVPEMIELARPIYEVRERKVKARGQPIRHSTDPKILAYLAPEESSNSEAIRRNLRETIDLTDHKAERQAGKSYYSVVESLENPKIYYDSSEEEYGQGQSGEVSESAELFFVPKSEEDAELISNEDDRAEEDDCNHRDYRRNHAISEPQEEGQKSMKSSKYPPRFARNTSNNKNRYMCLKEDSGEASIEDQRIEDELFKVVKEKDHYMVMPVRDVKANNKEKYVSKKKYLKELDYEQLSKYKSPKYARLSPEKIEAGRHERSQNPQKTMEDYQAKIFGDEDLLQKIASKNSRKTKGSNAEDEIFSMEQKRDDVAQLKSDLEVTEDLDLDEALNMNKYELLMLIPVKNQKRSRQRRHVGNELFRDKEDADLNELSLDIIGPSNKERSEEMIIEKMKATQADDSDNLIHTTVTHGFTDNKAADDSISETSTTLNVKNSNPSTQQIGKMLKGYVIEEIVRSVPQTAADKGALIEVAIPRLEATVIGGLGKARHISESFEKFIDGFDNRFNQKQIEFVSKNPGSIKVTKLRNDTSISSDVFDITTTNVKRFFDFLSGMVHIFRFN